MKINKEMLKEAIPHTELDNLINKQMEIVDLELSIK